MLELLQKQILAVSDWLLAPDKMQIVAPREATHKMSFVSVVTFGKFGGNFSNGKWQFVCQPVMFSASFWQSWKNRVKACRRQDCQRFYLQRWKMGLLLQRLLQNSYQLTVFS